MATRINIPEEQLFTEVFEKKLTDLIYHVQLHKEIVSSNFKELHSMLAVREHSLLEELDDCVTKARREIEEKKKHLHELYTARESLQKDITSNELREVLESHLQALEKKIGEEMSREMNIGWVECVWKREELKECVSDVCKVVIFKERLFWGKCYRLKLSPIWSRPNPHTDTSYLSRMSKFLSHKDVPSNFTGQMAIDDITQNIFVTDLSGPVQVYDKEGNHLYDISMSRGSFGIALKNDFIYVLSVNSYSKDSLHQIKKSSNECIRTIDTQHYICGIDIDKNASIYVCEVSNNSIVVYDENLMFKKRIQLKSSHIDSDTQTHCIKLYDNQMYVMFGYNPHSHLQIFSLEGELIRRLIPRSEIQLCHFFSIDRIGNIIVTDYIGNEIKIFSNTGELIHTITNDMLPEGKQLCRPNGVAVDRQNRIIVFNLNKESYLLAF